MALLKHHMYHLHRITIVVINHLNDAIGKIPFYAKDESSMPELLKETKALVEQFETAQAIGGIEGFLEQVKADQAKSHIEAHQANSLIDPAMRLLELLREPLERHGDGIS